MNTLQDTMALRHCQMPEAHTPAVCALHIESQQSLICCGRTLLLQPETSWQPAGLQPASWKARETKYFVYAHRMPAGPLACQQTVPVH